MELDKTVIPFSIFAITIMIIMFMTPYTGDLLGNSFEFEEKLDNVNVFFKDGGTTATKFKAALYDETDNYVVATAEGDILVDSWNTATFSSKPTVKNGHEYSIMVSANGDFSIPSDVSTGWIEETVTGYGSFPSTIDSAGDTAQLSIYASYV